MKQVLILGGGLGGYYTAKGLESSLRDDEAQITLVDMHSYLVYQPFLAEVAGGAIEPRHIQVPLQQNLPKTRVVRAKVLGVRNADKQVDVCDVQSGEKWALPFDELVVALGGVTRTFPTPGVAENAIGLKSSQEALYIRDTVVKNLQRAASMPKGSRWREKLLSLVVVGGGLSGVECFAEVLTLARDLVFKTPGLSIGELNFRLVEVMDKIMPEVPREKSQWVIDLLERKGAHVMLETSIESARGNVLKLSDGSTIDCGLLVWTAGQIAAPVLKDTDLPLDARGRLNCDTCLHVVDAEGAPLAGVWGVGDCTKVEDLSGGGLPDDSCAPTAQHAVRQARVLAKNIVRTLRGEPSEEYYHANAGMVAGLGRFNGLFANGDKSVVICGLPAWLAHRGYHGLVLPSWERKLRVFGDWTGELVLGRDITSVDEADDPRALFVEHAVACA